MSNWRAHDGGRTIGKISAEGGKILLDENYGDYARMTLKLGNTFIAVSANVYGWIDHTRFFNSPAEAQREYELMKVSVENMVDLLTSDASSLKMWEAIAAFVRRFP